MKKMTETNVKDALAGESQAHIRYLAFSAKAASENLPNIARVFQATAFSEQVHATNHLKTLAGVGTTAANLGAARSRGRPSRSTRCTPPTSRSPSSRARSPLSCS